ncbi:hypothetical protein ABZ619_17100 [Streptomyces sp. NPDC007851]|uniref:hypothetical protein n=1 Tax=Streptomyces sp. NPDC007851 TaxID=3155008 RepID=UPI0033F7BB0E
MGCSTGSPITDLAKGFFEFLGDPIGTIVGLIAKTILAGAIAVYGALVTGVPTLDDTTTSKDVSGQTQWLVVYLAVGSLLFAACRMAVERRATAGTTALKGMARVIVVSGAATTIALAAGRVADDYSKHLFDASVQNTLSGVGYCADESGIEPFLLLVLAFLLLIAGIIQTILMYIRLGVMILLLGTLPLAAAASMTDWGSGWWRKHIGWMIAWLLYKPAAALVMYSGTAMINVSTTTPNNGGDVAVNQRIAGIGVMLLSAVALPALLKLVVPATAALGGASAYTGAMQSVGGGLATGARSLGGAGGSGSGGQGRSGPSGASGGSGGAGSAGASGSNGAGGASGGGRSGQSGAGGGTETGGAGATGGAGRAAAAAGGPAGVAVAAAVTAAQVAGRAASGSLEGADGDQGHNPSPHH